MPASDATGGAKGRPRRTAIVEAIRNARGILAVAARALGIPRGTLAARVSRDPRLQAVVAEAREVLLDDAESVILQAVQAGDKKVARWVLATLGRGRGFGAEGAPEPAPEPPPLHGCLEVDHEVAACPACGPRAH